MWYSDVVYQVYICTRSRGIPVCRLGRYERIVSMRSDAQDGGVPSSLDQVNKLPKHESMIYVLIRVAPTQQWRRG